MAAYFLGIDIGTGATKTVLLDSTGNAVGSASAGYPLFQPQNGWAEQAPEDWWQAVILTVNEVLAKSQVRASEVKGIGLTGQMHGLVLLDAAGNVLDRALIWCDQRTAAECGQINERVGERRLLEITANPALTGFTSAKILWVRNNRPEVYERCRHMLLPKDFIRFRLTGSFKSEMSDASGTGLLDVANRSWSEELLTKLGIEREFLPDVEESPFVTSHVSAAAADLTGLAPGTPVVGGAGDNAAAAVGNGVVEDGKAFTTIGTSGVIFAHTSRMLLDSASRVHTFCCAVPGHWHVMGVTQAAGLSLKWFRDNFCREEIAVAEGMGVDPYFLMDRQAARAPVGANRLIYLPYLMGERTPHLDPDCRGLFFGLSAIHTKVDLIRAVMEGVAYSLRDGYEIFKELGVAPTEMIFCGGGAKSPFWRQMFADVYGCRLRTTRSQGDPSIGAAILAAVGTGEYSSVEAACREMVALDEVMPPDPDRIRRYAEHYAVYRELYPLLKGTYQRLARLSDD